MPARLRGAVVALVALLLAALAGCSSYGARPGEDASGPAGAGSVSSAAPAPSAPAPALARFYAQRLAWRDCGGGFDCAWLTVPVDYATPDTGSLQVAVVRLPAAGDRLGSLVVNPGGPGASGVAYGRAARTVVSSAVRERYDVVGFDPRGVGASRPIDCLSDRQLDVFLAQDGTPDSPAEEAELVRQGELMGAGCLRDDPALAPHLSTLDTARDMDVLRAALGDARLSYLGKSYGTYLGALYAEQFPSRVGRLVLDGPVNPAATNLANARGQAVGFQRALESFLTDCVSRSSCPFTGSAADAQARLQRLLDATDTAPLRGDRGRPVTQALATYGVAIGLYDRGYWAYLRQALDDALRGDGRLLLTLADQYNDRGPGGRYRTNAGEAIYAINCLDRPEPFDVADFRAAAARVAAVSPVFGPFIVWSNLPCATWPAPPEGAPGPVRAAGSAPILVVGTTRDPATPYESAVALAGQLQAGRLLTYVGDGHTAYRRGSACIDRAVDAYLLAGTVPAEGTRCT